MTVSDGFSSGSSSPMVARWPADRTSSLLSLRRQLHVQDVPPDGDVLDAQALIGAGQQQHDPIGGRVDDRDAAVEAVRGVDARAL